MGQPQQSLRDIQRLADSSELDPHSAELTWTRSFLAAWNDEAAEKHVRNAIMWAVDAGRYGDLSQLYITLVLVLIRASRVPEAQAALEEANRSGAWSTAAGTWAASAGPQEGHGPDPGQGVRGRP